MTNGSRPLQFVQASGGVGGVETHAADALDGQVGAEEGYPGESHARAWGDRGEHAAEEGQAPAHASECLASAHGADDRDGPGRAEGGGPGDGPVGLGSGQEGHSGVEGEDRQRAGDTETHHRPVRVLAWCADEREDREGEDPAAHDELEGGELDRPPGGPGPARGGVAAGGVEVAEQVADGGPVVGGVPDRDGQQPERCDGRGGGDGARAERRAEGMRSPPGGPDAERDAREDEQDGVLEQEADGHGRAEPQPGRCGTGAGRVEGARAGPHPAGGVGGVDGHQRARQGEARHAGVEHGAGEGGDAVGPGPSRGGGGTEGAQGGGNGRGSADGELGVAEEGGRGGDQPRDAGSLAVVRPAGVLRPEPVVGLVLGEGQRGDEREPEQTGREDRAGQSDGRPRASGDREPPRGVLAWGFGHAAAAPVAWRIRAG